MYLGNQPALSYTSFAKQDFTTSATTSYTLDNPVTNENEIALFINFVRQEPTTAYTASGTSLTLTSATSASDDMYCVFLGKAVQTVNPPSGSVGSSQVAASIITGQTAETSIATDDTVLIHDTSAGALRKMTRANFVSGVGGDNTPAFQAKYTSSQTLAHATATKIQFNSELFDTDNCYDNSTNYRFTPTVAGKYVVGLKIKFNNSQSSRIFTMIYKNGSEYDRSEKWSDGAGTDLDPLAVQIIDFNGSSDYVEAFAQQESGSNMDTNSSTDTRAYFYAYKLIT